MQVAAAHHLQEVTRKSVEGRAKLGVTAFAEALLGIPKILAENSGYDAQVESFRRQPHVQARARPACVQPSWPLKSQTRASRKGYIQSPDTVDVC